MPRILLAAGLQDLLAKGYRLVKLNDTEIRAVPGQR
jgi:hypothetical protein